MVYINKLPKGAGWDRPGELYRILTSVSRERSDDFLGEPEDVRLAERYVMTDAAGAFRGRLYASVQPVIELPSKTAAIVMTLAARGNPIGSGAEGLTRFFDLGHDWIVRGFASMTTREMHAIWRRRDA